MTRTIILAVGALLLSSAASLANSTAASHLSTLGKIIGGHAAPGETATSTSNPEVTYRVLDSGAIEMTNTRYNTVQIVQPTWTQGMGPRENRR